jgi:hypothetical protein
MVQMIPEYLEGTRGQVEKKKDEKRPSEQGGRRRRRRRRRSQVEDAL